MRSLLKFSARIQSLSAFATLGIARRFESVQQSHQNDMERVSLLENLSNEVFSRGNVHLKNVETLTSLPEGLYSFPEVCFIGKPNAGKSTLISCLLHNQRLAKGGAVPGTTRLLQFFNVGDALLLVDTPGYGGWRGRQLAQNLSERANAFSILFRYLSLRKESNLKHVYWLMESSPRGRMSLGPRDEEILTFLRRENIKFSVVLTKLDRHHRYFAQQQKILEQPSAIQVDKGGVPKLHGNDSHKERVAPPDEGIRRNMLEIFDFLETDTVPILGVIADRKFPERCSGLESLQHDIVHHCCSSLKNEELTVERLHELSYAPPTADEIMQTQLKYPIEAFVVPQDNRLSLQEMVSRHEEAKGKLISRLRDQGKLTAKEMEQLHLGSSEESFRVQQNEENERRSVAKLPLKATVLQLPNATDAQTEEKRLSLESTAKGINFSRRATLRKTNTQTNNSPWDNNDWLEDSSTFDGEEEEDGDAMEAKVGVSSMKDQSTHELAYRPAESLKGNVYNPPSPLPLPMSLDPNSHYVEAINGVRIPRSMLSASVAELAIHKEDELPAFAMKSGAGAYEEILLLDEEDTGSPFFLQFSESAALTQGQLDHTEQSEIDYHKSVRHKQDDTIRSKYVENERKERSIYVQAEGFMCPWLAGAGQPNRRVVMGAGGGDGSGQGNSKVLKGLKKHGFGGGRSYSARTMRNKGRATKKTGKWAT